MQKYNVKGKIQIKIKTEDEDRVEEQIETAFYYHMLETVFQHRDKPMILVGTTNAIPVRKISENTYECDFKAVAGSTFTSTIQDIINFFLDKKREDYVKHYKLEQRAICLEKADDFRFSFDDEGDLERFIRVLLPRFNKADIAILFEETNEEEGRLRKGKCLLNVKHDLVCSNMKTDHYRCPEDFDFAKKPLDFEF